MRQTILFFFVISLATTNTADKWRWNAKKNVKKLFAKKLQRIPSLACIGGALNESTTIRQASTVAFFFHSKPVSSCKSLKIKSYLGSRQVKGGWRTRRRPQSCKVHVVCSKAPHSSHRTALLRAPEPTANQPARISFAPQHFKAGTVYKIK